MLERRPADPMSFALKVSYAWVSGFLGWTVLLINRIGSYPFEYLQLNSLVVR